MSVTAASIINTVRDLVPDPVYDSSGQPAPGTDGTLFRVSTLYRWLDDAIKMLVQRTGWVVEDWYAIGVQSSLPFYPLDPKWINVENAFKDAWRLSRVDEQITIWPSQTGTTKSLWFFTRRVTDHWEIGFFNYPTNTDPATYLTATMNPTTTVMTVNLASGNWLPYGFVSVDNELMWYGAIVTGNTQITPLQRGVAGTTAATHTSGASVNHLSLWFKGKRLPLSVVTSTDVVEVPGSFVYPLQVYVLARCRQAENEFQEARALMQEFLQLCEQIREDPQWRNSYGMQTLAYGQPILGPLAFGRVIIP